MLIQNENLEEYLREKIEKTVEDIVKSDSEENKKINLEYLNMTLINMCDCFGLLTRGQVEELRKPIIDELRRL